MSDIRRTLREAHLNIEHATVHPFSRPHILDLSSGVQNDVLAKIIGCSSRVTQIRFEDLTPEKLAEHDPSTVMSRVILGRNDCLDVALFLAKQDYQGSYRIYGDFPSNPSVLLADLKSHCPDIDIGVLAIT